MANETYQKVNGQRYRVLANKSQRIWKELSFKTAAEDVYFKGNESESLPSIVGITYTKNLPIGESLWQYPIPTLTNQSKVDIYTDNSTVSPNKVEVDTLNHLLNCYFTPQDTVIVVKAVVGAFVDSDPA